MRRSLTLTGLLALMMGAPAAAHRPPPKSLRGWVSRADVTCRTARPSAAVLREHLLRYALPSERPRAVRAREVRRATRIIRQRTGDARDLPTRRVDRLRARRVYVLARGGGRLLNQVAEAIRRGDDRRAAELFQRAGGQLSVAGARL